MHVVFTLPRELAPLALQNQKLVYDLLFRASARALFWKSQVIPDISVPRSDSSACHTWNQKLDLHPHVHCVIPAGGLSRIARGGSSHATASSYP